MKAAPFFPLALIVGLLILCSLPRAAQAACGPLYCWGSNDSAEQGVSDLYGMYFATALQVPCTGPVRKAGSIIYNTDFKVMKYCDGMGWVKIRQ